MEPIRLELFAGTDTAGAAVTDDWSCLLELLLLELLPLEPSQQECLLELLSVLPAGAETTECCLRGWRSGDDRVLSTTTEMTGVLFTFLKSRGTSLKNLDGHCRG